MNEAAITRYISETFEGVDVVQPKNGDDGPEIAWGDTFFIYDPDRNLESNRTFPFATIVTKDYGDFDRASNLNRPGVFRLNIGVSKETYRSLFGQQPSAPSSAGSVVNTGHDFATLDKLMPHPIYASQSWVCILNPSDETFQTVQPLLADAYNLSAKRHSKSKHK